jgi:putative peptidoglycan lipid II flippase
MSVDEPTPAPSGHKQPNVARAGGIMVASLLLSRILGIVRDQVMVWTFGRNQFTDAYRWAFQIPDLLFFLIAGGALSSAFIPIFSEYLHTDRDEDAWKTFSVVTSVMSLIVFAFIALAWVFAMPLTHVIAPGSEADAVRPLIAYMSRIILPAQYAFFIGGLMFGTLYARQKFAVPGLGPNIYNVGIIFGAVVISHYVSPGVIGMTWGALIGAILGNLVVPLIAMRGLRSRYWFSLDIKHEGARRVFRLMLPVILGLSLPGVYGMIMQGFASFFPKGTATALDIANKLMQAPLGIFGQSLAIAVFPALTQFFAQKRMDLYRKQLASTLRTVIYITVPISAVMILMSPEIVTLLFQYGKKFESADTHVVASCLQMFGIGVTAWCLHPVLMRGFFAVQNTVVPILLGTLTTALFVSLCLILRQTSLSYLALPLASSLSAIALAIMLLTAVNKKVEGIDIKGILMTFVKAVLAGLLMSVVLYAGLSFIPTGTGLKRNLFAFVKVVGVGLTGAWVYYFATRRLGMPESKYIDRALARVANRKQPVTEAGSDPDLPKD